MKISYFKNKKIAFVFSDPGGAKSTIAFYLELKKILQDQILISDRFHAFYNSMGVEVEIIDKKNVESFIENFRPDIIITGTSFPSNIELNCIKYFTNKIPIISIIDHWINFKMRFVLNEQIYYPNNIFVIDKIAKKNATKEGIPKELIILKNNSYFNYLKKWVPSLTYENLKSLLGIELSCNYILYAPEPLSTFQLKKKFGFDEIDGLVNICKIFHEEKLYINTYIIVKCHANQDPDIFNKFINTLNNDLANKIIVLIDFDINILIYYSKIVIGFFSNSLIEAIIMKKNVIRNLIGLQNKNLDSLSNKKIGFIANSQIELKKNIVSLLKS